MNIAHIVNPVRVDRSSDLFLAQPVTFESMRIARECAGHNMKIALYSAQFTEDRDVVPDFFCKTMDLNRSVLDLGFFEKKRKLPLLRDILDRLYEASNADYYIYTNADIGLMPAFYSSIGRIISDGLDAFVINRRTVPDCYRSVEQIPLIYAQVGQSHIGHDCFVFKRLNYSRFKLGRVCLGVRLVGRVLLWNLLAFSQKFAEFKNLHLTFHLGENKPWKNPAQKDYDQYNLQEAQKVLNLIDKEQNFRGRLNKEYSEYMTGIS